MPYHKKFISSHIIFYVILLSLVFFDWNGYGYYIFYIPLIFLSFKSGFYSLDKNFCLLLLFGLTYSLFDYLNTGEIGYVYNILPIINFPIAYLMGKFIGKNSSYRERINILWLFAVSMSLLTIISVTISMIEDGFSLVTRDISLIGYEDSGNKYKSISATGLYSKLLPVTLFLSLIFVRNASKVKWLFIITAIMGFICCVRLQSRSAIYVMALSLLLPIIFGTKTSRRNKILGLITIVSAVAYILINYGDELTIIDRFKDNSAFENAGGDSRFDLASKTINNVVDYPFGGLKSERYAHNLWIDAARVSGWIPAILLIIIAVRCIVTTFKIYRLKSLPEFYRIISVVITLCLIVYFNTEPILEGASMLFTYFCLYSGIIADRRKQIKYSHEHPVYR